jgi:hypothetical protein
VDWYSFITPAMIVAPTEQARENSTVKKEKAVIGNQKPQIYAMALVYKSIERYGQ